MRQPRALIRLFAGIAIIAATLDATIIEPTDLSPGDTYRYIFVTEATTTSFSANIADYNNVVANEVAITPDLFALGTTWKALASTPTVNALANAGLSPADTTTSFYNVLGQLIAVGVQVPVTGLYGVETLHTAPILSASGNQIQGFNSYVWTGTSASGITYPFLSLGDTAQIGECLGTPCHMAGYAGGLNSGWTESGPYSPIWEHRLYGVSGELTATAETPEPATLTMMLLGVLALTVTKRKRQCRRRVF